MSVSRTHVRIAMERELMDLSTEKAGPLSGVLVADLSRVLAGPYATQLLGDMGATVVKVEAPTGDETRGWKPPAAADVSTYYLGVNRNKKDAVFDFRNADDLELVRELIRRADVVIENFKPGGLAKYGLDYASARELNPRIVYVSISGFGPDGGARLAGYDLVVQAASGLMSLTGDPDGGAYRSGVSVFDVMTGMQALIGLLAALRHRDRTGEGQHVEVNLLSTALSAMANHASTFINTGQVPFRMGNAHPSLFPYEPLPASDGEIIVVAANDAQFSALCDVLDRPDLPADARFATPDDRNRNREELRPLLIDALSKRGVQEWFELLSARGVACGPINTIDGGIALAEQLGLAPVIELDNGIRTIRNPISFSATPPSYRTPPPSLGADDEEIRAWLTTKEEDR